MFKKNKNKNQSKNTLEAEDNNKKQLSKSLNDNVAAFRKIFGSDDTIVYRDIENAYSSDFRACVIYIDGMIDTDITNKNIIQPIMNSELKIRQIDDDLLDKLKSKVISTNQIKKTGNIDDLVFALFNGDVLLLVDRFNEALQIGCKGWETRAIEEPGMEKVLRGPKEGFTESLITNLSLIRRKLKTTDLKFKFREIGVRSKTKVCICYIETIASNEIIRELEKRLDDINIDGVIETGYIEELIKDCPLSPFKTIGNTERPDVVAGKLLEGRIALILDGTPSALTLPYVFIEYFQTAEDYFDNFYFSSINRIVRYLGEFFTTSIPPIYISLITYHQEMIPTPLLLSITASRQGVPFPTIVEAIILLFIFEMIREASIRMPSTMGQSVGIVGALILGQAAIEAKLFSAPMVVVIAATGISGLINLKLKGANIVIRLFLTLLSGIMGLYGYIFGVIACFIYMYSMRSFGIPYMLEIGSINPVDLKDTAIRAPWFYMKMRPKTISAKNIIRQKVSKAKGT